MSSKEKLKVMLVDDNEIDIFINQKVLEFNNFSSEIINIQAAQLGIDYLKNSDIKDIPEVIFLDLNMPIVDGFRFLFEYDQMKHEVKEKSSIVVLTSSDNVRDKEKIAANKDVLAFISKPLTDKKLIEIRSLLNK
jgi:CheY-like chemotaxis protein